MNSFSRSRMIAWTVWIIASTFYAYQYILRVMPNIIMNDIMQQFDIGAATFGQFSGVYYIGYSLLHLPVGIMLDRFGPKKVMTFCILLMISGLFPLLYATHWVYPLVGRFLTGFGSSAAILGIFKIIRMTFSEKQFSRMLSFSVTIGLMGAIYGGGPVNYMYENYGYDTVIKAFVFIGILLAAATYTLIPSIQYQPEKNPLSNLKEVLSNWRVLSASIFAGFMVGPLEGFADVWGTAFLKYTYGFQGNLAASLPSMIFIGMCFGAPLLNFLAEKLGSHLLAIVGAGIVMALNFILILFANLSRESISISFLIVGACSSYQILAIYQASTYAREEVAGLTTAIANMIIMIFGYVFHTLIGVVITSLGGPHLTQAMIYGISVIPIGLILGTLGFVVLLSRTKRSETAQLV